MAELPQVLAQLTHYSHDTYLTVNLKLRNNVMMTPLAMMTEFLQPLQVQSHLEMLRILVQLGHIQCT